MQEKLLLKISLIGALIGILILFFLSEHFINVDEVSIEKLDELNEGTDVKIKGIVRRLTDLEKIAILDISQPKSVTVILFKEGNLTIKEGDYIQVVGEIEEYEGKMELIANEIKRLD